MNVYQKPLPKQRMNFSSPLGLLWDRGAVDERGRKLAATWSTGYHRWHNGVSPETRVKRDNGSVHISGIHCPIDPQSVTLGGCETSKRGGGGQREHAPGDDNHRPVNGGRVPLQWSSPLVRPTLLSFNKLLTHRSELIRISRFAKRMDEHEFQLVSLFRVKMMKRSRGSVFARVFVFFIIRCCV